MTDSLAINTVQPCDTAFHGAIDTGRITDGLIWLTGWALDRETGRPPERFTVLWGDALVLSLEPNVVRPDLDGQFASNEIGALCGFTVQLSLSTLIQAVVGKLRILAIASDGRRTDLQKCFNAYEFDLIDGLTHQTFYRDAQSFETRSSNPWLVLALALVGTVRTSDDMLTQAACVSVAVYRLMELRHDDPAVKHHLLDVASVLLAAKWAPLSEFERLRWYSSLLMASGYLYLITRSVELARSAFARLALLAVFLSTDLQMIHKVVRCQFYLGYIALAAHKRTEAALHFYQSWVVLQQFLRSKSPATFHDILELEHATSIAKEAMRVALIVEPNLNVANVDYERPSYLLRFSCQVIFDSLPNLKMIVDQGYLPDIILGPVRS